MTKKIKLKKNNWKKHCRNFEFNSMNHDKRHKIIFK